MGFWLFIIITVVFWGTSPIFEKTALKSISPAEGVLLRSIVIMIFMAAFVGISGNYDGLRALNWKVFAFIAIGAVLSGALGQMTYFSALKFERASVVVPIVASFPLMTVILSASFLGEQVTLWRVMGAIMVVAGVILVKLG